MQAQLNFDDAQTVNVEQLKNEIANWVHFGTATSIDSFQDVPVYINEFWTSRQRAAHSLHEISYRACFKPQLPNYFITRLTDRGDVVLDPFMGRGTTVLEAALMGRNTIANDINPLSRMLLEARLTPPGLNEIEERLNKIDLTKFSQYSSDLEVFFDTGTLKEITALKEYFTNKERNGEMDDADRWIRMVALNRLTGHSKGFFSVYTLPPNQATSIERQRKINEKRGQAPEYRGTKAIIMKKTRSLLKDNLPSCIYDTSTEFFNINLNSEDFKTGRKVRLSVTSPPFMNIVDYKADNWMRCWFAGIDADSVEITQTPRLEQWKELITNSLNAVAKITLPGGFFAFEVGEIQNGALRLEEAVVDASAETQWTPELILINQQDFTKTSNTWGVSNNAKGTNTNRIVLFRLDD